MWPEEQAKKVSFYFDRGTSSKKGSSSSSSSSSAACYHLTYQTGTKNGKEKKQLILYHSKTNEIVDIMNPHDIIGAELEITFEEEKDYVYSDKKEEDEKGNSGTDRAVGINNDKAKERADRMEQYEKKLGEKLIIGGNIDEYDYDQIDQSDEHKEYDDNEVNENDKASGSKCTSAAYLNIFCYPRSLPSPGLKGLLKSCYMTKSSEKVKLLDKENLAQELNDADDINDMDESKLGNRYEKQRRYKLVPTEDFSDVQCLIQAIRKIANLGHFVVKQPQVPKGDETDDKTSKPSPEEKRQNYLELSSKDSKINHLPIRTRQRYLVVVNPFSGTKKGKTVYETLIQKMLHQCGVDHDVLFTQHAGHATERMQKVDHNNKNDDDVDNNNDDAILDVSEYDAVIAVGGDGILSEIINGLSNRDDFDTILEHLKLGIVGCGTCNGFAASLLHAVHESYGVLESVFRICKGQVSKIDLSKYETKNNSYIGFLTMTWAMIADIDIESEKIRFLGNLRMDVWGAWRVLNLRSYKAKFSYLPVDEDSEKKMTPYQCPELGADVPSNWITIEDDFILFMASQVSHSSYNIQQSPNSKLQDGVFRVWIIRKPCSRVEIAGMLIDMEKGKHVVYKRAEFYDCTAFRLEPLSQGSFNDVDGEVVDPGIIQSHVLPAALSFIV